MNKYYNQLSLAIIMLSATLLVFSFVPEIELWQDFFTFEMKAGWKCHHGGGTSVDYQHRHWNYRGWVWFLTGLTLFVIQVVRIVDIFSKK